MALQKEYSPVDVTISVGGSTITGWDFGDYYHSKPSTKRRTIKDAIPVGKMPFAQYISKRLVKDNLGFVPIQNRMEALTVPGQQISSVIPNCVEDLLVYFHELGHNKSKQPPSASRSLFGGFSTCNATLEREYNAWVWALKYFRRLGYELTQSCKEVVRQSFESYINNAGDESYARVKASQLSSIVGIELQIKEKRKVTFGQNSFITVNSWFEDFGKVKPVKEKPKPKGHKPWHDFKQKQMKKAWKHQR